ncbi:MAG: alpha/beta hydrolase [Pseudomonadota bacterium]
MSTADPVPGAGTGSGGSGSPGTGGAISGGTGGALTPPAGTGGAVSSTGGSVGSTGGAGTGGATSSTGGASAGGAASGGGATGGAGLTGGRGGAPASTGGSVGSSGGAGGTVVVVVTPPVADSASKVPIMRAPTGYKVEGNFAYGKLTAQRLDVLYPTSAGPKGTQTLPAVLMFHGGGWVHSYTNNYGSGKDHMTTFSDRFLAHGFIVFNAEYRVADNTPDGALAPAAVEDALLAAKWAWDYMDYFHGDRSRFVVTGASAGGHLALMVGMATADSKLGPTHPADFKIAGIVDGYGIADVQAVLNGLAQPWIPASLPNRADVVKAVNPMTYIRKDIPPMIVVQGANDNTAPVGDSRRMVTMLKAAGADATMHEVPGAGHGYASPAGAWDDAEKAMFDWLVAHGMGK